MYGRRTRPHNEAGIHANSSPPSYPYIPLLSPPLPVHLSPRPVAGNAPYVSYVHTWPGCRRTCRWSYAYTVTAIAVKADPVDLEMPRIAASIWNSARNTVPGPRRLLPPINPRKREREKRARDITYEIPGFDKWRHIRSDILELDVRYILWKYFKISYNFPFVRFYIWIFRM